MNDSEKVTTVEEVSIETEVSVIPESSHIVNTGITVTDYFKQKLNKEPQPEEIKKSKKNKKLAKDEKMEQELPEEVEIKVEKREKKKRKIVDEEVKEVAKIIPNPAEDSEITKGANAIYNPQVIQVTSHVANKMAKMSVHNFTSANIGNIVGYGMAENVEIKVIQSKLVDNSLNTDKYSIYNMDKVIKSRVNPRKILTKIKKTKKSIQVM